MAWAAPRTVDVCGHLSSLQVGGRECLLPKSQILWALGALQASCARLEDDHRALCDSLHEAGVLPLASSLQMRATAYRSARLANAALSVVAPMQLLRALAGDTAIVRLAMTRFAMTANVLRKRDLDSGIPRHDSDKIATRAKTPDYPKGLQRKAADAKFELPAVAPSPDASPCTDVADEANTTQCIPSLDELLASLDLEEQDGALPTLIGSSVNTLGAADCDESSLAGHESSVNLPQVPASSTESPTYLEPDLIAANEMAQSSAVPSQPVADALESIPANSVADGELHDNQSAQSSAEPSQPVADTLGSIPANAVADGELHDNQAPQTWQEKKAAALRALDALAKWQAEEVRPGDAMNGTPSAAGGELRWHEKMAQKHSDHMAKRSEAEMADAAEEAFRESVRQAAAQKKLVDEERQARKRKKRRNLLILGEGDEEKFPDKVADCAAEPAHDMGSALPRENLNADTQAKVGTRRRGGAFSRMTNGVDRSERVAPAPLEESEAGGPDAEMDFRAAGPEETLRINARLAVSGDKIAKLTLQGASLVQDLREAIQESWGADGILQVSFEEVVLDDDMRICDTGIYDYATVFVERMPPLYVLTSSADNTVRIWRTATAKFADLRGHASQVQRAMFAASDSRVVTASVDGTAKIWSSVTGLCERTLQGHLGQVITAVFSPDEQLVLTASADRTARLWNVEDAVCVRTLQGHKGTVTYAQFSPDGSQVVTASADETLRVWNTQTGECLRSCVGHCAAVFKASFSPDSSRLLSTSIDGPPHIWFAEIGQCAAVLKGHFGPALLAEFSPDSTQVVTGGHDGFVRLWSINLGSCLHVLRGHSSQVLSVVFSPSGTSVASSAADSTARLWDVRTGNCLKILKGHSDHVNQVVFSRDGWMVLTGSTDGTAKVWSTESGRCSHTFKGHRMAVLSVQFSHS